MIYDVFVSYAAEDADHALKLRAKLEGHDLSCFLAAKGLRPGEDFAEGIRTSLLECRTICVLATPSSLASEWVTTEWGAAWALGKPVIPILLRCGPKDLPDRLARLQCVDFHDVGAVATAIKGSDPVPALSSFGIEVLPYASPEFRKHHRLYLNARPSDVWLLSYTGETTDGILLGFEEMDLETAVRLLVRDWAKERIDEDSWNAAKPNRPRDWAKAKPIEETARSLPDKPWSIAAGGKIRLEQRFYPDPPFAKVVLYLTAEEPYAGFLGFYRYDSFMELGHPSIYVDVGQPMLRTEHPALLRMLRDEFDVRWRSAHRLRELRERDTATGTGAQGRGEPPSDRTTVARE